MIPIEWAVPGALAALPALEFSLRAFAPRSGLYYAWPPNRRLSFDIDTAALPLVVGPVTITTNAIGERGSTLPATPGEKAFRVLVVGGSSAEGWAIRDEDYWPNVLQRALDRPDFLAAVGADAARVGGIARSNCPIPAIEFGLQTIAHRYRNLDAIVAFVGASDILGWLENECAIGPIPAAGQDTRLFRMSALPPFGGKASAMAIAKYAKVLRQRLFPSQVEAPPFGKTMVELRAKRARAKRFLDNAPNEDEFLAGFARDARAFLAVATRLAKRVFVVEQPWWYGDIPPEDESAMWHFPLGDPRKGSPESYLSHAAADRLLNSQSELLEDAARISDTKWVPTRKSIAPSRRIFYDYFHPTNEGSRLIGALCADAIRAAYIGRE